MTSDAEHDAQLEALFRARPELRLALPYLGAGNGPAQLALASIVRQWLEAVYAINEYAVAATKLRWWADELQKARDGHTHHPLASTLLADPAARDIAPSAWRHAVEAGLALRDAPPATSLAAQIAAAEPFHGALARLETTLCFGADATSVRAARLAALGHLASSLLHLGNARVDNDGLPMQQLARHGLERGALAQDTPPRREAIGDQLRDLQKAHADAMSLAGPISLPCALSARADRSQLRKAVRAVEPLAALADARLRVRPGQAWFAWRTGRRLAGPRNSN